ncbi:GNAT family N-acetyltransferase [Nostoc sp. 3335mG]|nr:GNAT family N-acetyltransferase [Nostoc sp. 3335mG]
MPPQFVAFRTATADDVPAIRSLVRQAYARWVPAIGREPRPMLVDYAEAIRDFRFDLLTIDGRLAGLLQTCPCADHLWIENLAVHPHHQRRGHGQSLLVLAEQLARHAGLDRLRLLTNAAFAGNIALFEKAGYTVEQREPFLGGTTLYMTRSLAPSFPIRAAHGWRDRTAPTAW